MKKLSMIVALTALTFGVSAQTLNVQSAIQDLKKNYLNKAKAEIDAACEHESTKDDAKTWCYKGLIYARIGGDAQSKKPKFKNLAPDWAEQAYAAAIECKRLDTKNEYAEENKSVFRFVGNEYYNRATKAYNEEQYAEAIQLADKGVEMFQNTADKNFTEECLYIAGISARALNDTEGMKKYFSRLVRTRTQKSIVYRTLFNQYHQEGDNDKAMSVANSYSKNCKDNYDADLLLAEAYLNNNNLEKGKDMLNKALEKTKDSVALYSQLLCAAAGILENTQDFEGAEARYNESLTLTPDQFDANFGMGKMIFNRAVDKLTAANAIPPDDETGIYDKLFAESKDFFGRSIGYFTAAVDYIDRNMPNANAALKGKMQADLFNCLQALKTCYTRSDMGTEALAVSKRMEAIQNGGN